jgi:hypothetical protein
VIATDGLANIQLGVGTDRDRIATGAFTHREVSIQEADALYRSSWIGRKVVDVRCGDMVSAWRDWQETGDATARAIEAEEARLKLRAVVLKALVLASVTGGAAIILGFGDADPSKPAPPAAGKGGLRYIAAVPRDRCSAPEMQLDPSLPFYGEGARYQVGHGTARLVDMHPSRVIPVVVRPRPDVLSHQPDPWGENVYTAMYDALIQATTASAALATLLVEAKVDVVKMPDLDAKLQTPAGEERVLKRINLARQARHFNGTVIIGGGEEWQARNVTFGSIADVHIRLWEEVAGAADIPLTRLLGRAPGGLNATGDHDTANYFSSIAADQERILRPILERIDAYLVPSATGRKSRVGWWKFSPLAPADAAKDADTALKWAQADRALADTGALAPDALAKAIVSRLVATGAYPALKETAADAPTEPAREQEPDPSP